MRHLAMSIRPVLDSWENATADSSWCSSFASCALLSASARIFRNSRCTAGSRSSCLTCTGQAVDLHRAAGVLPTTSVELDYSL